MSDYEDEEVEEAVQDALERKDWETSQERGSKTAQLLLLGAAIAICGLLISLFLLLFNTRCTVDMRKGIYVERGDGNWEMCKSSVGKWKMEKAGEHPKSDGLSIEIIGTTCKVDSDCGDGSTSEAGAFCAGGPHGVYVPGYCETNHCTCKNIIYNCGTQHYFVWPYTPSTVVQNCSIAEAWKCSKNLDVKVPLWKTSDNYGSSSKSWIGCDLKERTQLIDVMVWVQNELHEIGIIQSLLPQQNPVWKDVEVSLSTTPDVRFASFWPSTISESVSNGFSPEGRIFFGFMLCSALCLLVSRYTTEIETVSLPGKELPIVGVSYDTMRAWLPPIGLILLSTVQMVPTSEILNIKHVMMTAVHLCGAQFCFVVYLACEARALLDDSNVSEMQPREYQIRAAICLVGSLAMLSFAITYLILIVFSGTEFTPYVKSPFTGKSDMYKYSFSIDASVLVRPAEGQWKNIKVISYVSEYTVAMTILISHLVIWFFFKQTLKGPARGFKLGTSSEESQAEALLDAN